MNMQRCLAVVVVALELPLASACGSDDDPETGFSDAGSIDNSNGTGGLGEPDGSSGSGGIDNGGHGGGDSGDSGNSGNGDASGAGGVGGIDGVGGTGGDEGNAGGSGGGTGGSTNACSFSTACADARFLGTVRGDKGSDTLQTTGISSEWLRVRVIEADEGLAGRKLRLSITLQPADGSDFNLYARIAEKADASACSSAVAGFSMNTMGQADTVSLEWGEDAASNGSNDSRNVVLEVRHEHGACEPAARWTLSVSGN